MLMSLVLVMLMSDPALKVALSRAVWASLLTALVLIVSGLVSSIEMNDGLSWSVVGWSLLIAAVLRVLLSSWLVAMIAGDWLIGLMVGWFGVTFLIW